MEVAMEDDVFFADLNRQISLLIKDDDEDYPVTHYYPLQPAAFPPAIFHQQNTFPHQVAAPLIQHPQDCRREIRGTGVFIPRSSQPRRKNKGKNSSASSAKSSSYNSKKHQHLRLGYATSNNDSNAIPTSYNYNNRFY